MSKPELMFEQIRLSRDHVAEVFADRPRLEDVAESLINDWIKDGFPDSTFKARELWVGVMKRMGDVVAYDPLMSLSEALILRCMSKRPLNYTPGHHQVLVGAVRDSVKPAATLMSVDDLEFMLNTLASALVPGFQARLVEYWNGISQEDPISTRWRVVSEQLRKCLKTARQTPPLSESQQRRLGEIYPLKADRQRFGGLPVYQVYAASGTQPGQWLALLVFQITGAGADAFHVYSPVTDLFRVDSQEQLGRLLPRYMSHYPPGEPIQWSLKEPEGDVFDSLAQSLLEKQLRDLSQIDWRQFPRVASYKQLFSTLTSPLAWFDPDVGRALSEEQLPLWLQTGSSLDRQTYGHWLGRLADVQQRAGGAGFLDGIDPIDVYARKALQRQMALDHPREGMINPDDYVLTFVRTQGATVGWTESVSRTLTQWSLENPFATPYARLDIRNRASPDGKPARKMTEAYLKRLIPTVDIGKHYPLLIKDRLILDPVESARRRRLFVEQMSVQLPMLALESVIRGLGGLTTSGYRVVQAMVQPTAALRVVDGEPIVARRLDILEHSGGRAHRASNLFVIGPRDNSTLPHILYHPSSLQAFIQFSSRQALLEEVLRSGSELQRIVLSSMSERSRVLFDNGGFLTPHSGRFLQGDEYGPIASPSPALLSDLVMPEGFLDEVFKENARSLWLQADRQSVSNEELRWTLFKNDLWQLFNVLLPLLRGPVAVAGWLTQVLASTQAFVALPEDADQAARAAVVSELIASLSGLLMSRVMVLDERLGLSEAKPGISRLPEATPKPVAVSFSWRRISGDVTEMDFSWANASQRLSPSQMAQVATFKWRPKPGQAWPNIPANIETTGPARGLVRVNVGPQKWHHHAVIQGGFYPVDLFEGELRVVDLKQRGRWGPWLRRGRNDLWDFDLGMRLRGGGPKKSAAARHEENRRFRAELDERYNDLTTRLVNADHRVADALARYKHAHESHQENFTDLQRQVVTTRYLEALQDTSRVQFDKMDVLKAKNANKPMIGFETELIQQFEQQVENLRQQMALLILQRKAAGPTEVQRQAWLSQLDDDDPAQAQSAHEAMHGYLMKVAGFNDQLIDLSILELARFGELLNVPGFDPAVSPLVDVPALPATPLDWKTMQLKVYQGLVLRRRPLPQEYDDFVDLKRLGDQVVLAACSQKTLQTSDLVSLEQRIQGLEGLVQEYTDVQAWLRFYVDSVPDLVDQDMIWGLYRQIDGVRHEAQYTLALALGEQAAETVPRPVATQPRDTSRRLVRDRKNRLLAGRVRPQTSDALGEIVDVSDPVDHTPLASFRQGRGPDEWEPVVDAASPVVRPARSLRKLQMDARMLLDKEAAVSRQVNKDAQSSNAPISAQEQLTHLAGAMDDVAAKVRDTLRAQGKQPDSSMEQLLASLEQASVRLTEQGRQVRIAIILRNPPEESRIDYLKSQGQIDILLVEGRIKLKRDNDYLQEYVVRDKARKVVAYAHFHYPMQDTPNANYSAAHLKLPEQRYLSFRSLADMPESRAVAVYYARISTQLAEPLFLSVTQSIPRLGRLQYW
ncbi:hypothetical protein HZF02_13650 [Pseudomonas yamanorum]|nr:hypothetical protein HZF02_13650 [Pseudomonas yamanorum]